MCHKKLISMCAAILVFVLSGCGVSVDNSPRDIDPSKQAILEPATTLP